MTAQEITPAETTMRDTSFESVQFVNVAGPVAQKNGSIELGTKHLIDVWNMGNTSMPMKPQTVTGNCNADLKGNEQFPPERTKGGRRERRYDMTGTSTSGKRWYERFPQRYYKLESRPEVIKTRYHFLDSPSRHFLFLRRSIMQVASAFTSGSCGGVGCTRRRSRFKKMPRKCYKGD